MSDDTKIIQDAGLYERMSAPYETQEAAVASIDAFMKAVVALREQHRIANIVICASANGPAKPEALMISRGETSMVAILATQLYRSFAVPLLSRLMPKEADEG